MQIELDLGLPEAPSQDKQIEPNKMCRKFGYGPEDATCKTCEHLVRKRHYRNPNASWFKCLRQIDGNGHGTDMRQKWRACRKYKNREE